MGNSSSSEEADLSSQATRSYGSPADRERSRYMRSNKPLADPDDLLSVEQASVERYDYLIAFPNMKVPRAEGDDGEDEEKDEDLTPSQRRALRKMRLKSKKKKKRRKKKRKEPLDEVVEIPRINFEDACENWTASTPGPDRVKKEAREKLATEWRDRFRTPDPHSIDEALMPDYLSLVRELVISYLMKKCGLQLKVTLSRDQDEIFCRIRASQKMLRLEADRINYKLKFRGEVDPGYDFWEDDDEIKAAETRLTEEVAKVTLEKLHSVGKIPSSEVDIFPGETEDAWSRRIHTLERIADRVPVNNLFPVHTDYNADPKIQHLFQTYMGPYGPTLFTDKDRLVLTKSLIDRHLDCGVMQERGLINYCMALHDASRGSKLTREWLAKNWVTWWAGNGQFNGDITVAGYYAGPETRTPFHRRPFCQPLNHIKDYFGEKVGLYFAWLGFYTQSLIFPALFGLIAQVIYILLGDHNLEEGVDWLQAALCISVCLWTVVYKEFWDRENKVIAVKWGMEGFEEEEQPRPQFRGTPRRSIVTNRMEEYYPSHLRAIKQVCSFLIICVFIVLLIVTLLFIYWFRDFMLDTVDFEFGGEVASLLQALQIQIQSILFEMVVEQLNEWENHRTQTEYEDALIFKTFLFQLFNQYAALMYVAYVKRYTYGCDEEDCMGELQLLMIVIFVVRMFMNVVELGGPFAKQKIALYLEEAEMLRKSSEHPGKDLLGDAKSGKQLLEMEPFEAETKLDDYDDTFSDYAEMVLQYGLVTFFVAALPIAPFLAIVENIVEIRVDAYKMCHLVRRPDPKGAEDIGMWGHLIDAMSTLALFNNAGIIAFTTESFQDESTIEQFVIWMAVEHVLLAIKTFVHAAIPDDPDWLAEVKKRQEHIVQVHKLNYEDDDGEVEDTDEGEVNLSDLDMSGINKGKTKDKGALTALQRQVAQVNAELMTANAQLTLASATEFYNPETGVGETIQGNLPLGRLHLTLVSARNLPRSDRVIGRCDPYVIISLEPASAGPRTTYTSAVIRNTLEPIWNQDFVIAPISTTQAEVHFRIMDKDQLRRDQLKGRVSLPLSDLLDQRPHDLRLQLPKVKGSARQSVLYVQAQFQYSKVLPLRQKIQALEERKAILDRKITAHKLNLTE